MAGATDAPATRHPTKLRVECPRCRITAMAAPHDQGQACIHEHAEKYDDSKAARIAAACRAHDVAALVTLATSARGLLNDALRRAAWPLLLGCSPAAADARLHPWQELPAHRDEHQVGLDVARAFVFYPRNESDRQLDGRRKELSAVIVAVLRRHAALCYFQGYHDIAQVFLLVLGPRDAPAAVARLSLLRLRDFMLSSLDPALAQLQLLRPLLRAADPALFEHLSQSQPSFALAGTITLFAHNIQGYSDITRLFDFFLARHPVMPIYLFAAVVLSRRDELLAVDREDEDIIYVLLGKLPQPFDIEFHIARTVELFERLPPAALRSWEWWRLSSSSALKTSADIFDIITPTLTECEDYFAQQERELSRKQALTSVARALARAKSRSWYYRKYGYVGLAILIGTYAFWLGRTNATGSKPALLSVLTGLVRNIMKVFIRAA